MVTEAMNEWSCTSTPSVCLLDINRYKFAFTVKRLRYNEFQKCYEIHSSLQSIENGVTFLCG
jgi:hypothetical protein